ncbi:hypothetical protein BGW80DRAFT_1254892 [Lactifluus volemus]|nr:hypothetical protein BGW80DRAFT_1254892 [Lactifluus volemus]
MYPSKISRFHWKWLVDLGEGKLEQTRALLDAWEGDMTPRDYNLVQDQLVHVRDIQGCLINRPCWRRYRTARRFAIAAGYVLKMTEVVFSGDALVRKLQPHAPRRPFSRPKRC